MLWRGMGSLMRLGGGGGWGWRWRRERGAILEPEGDLGAGGYDVEGKMDVYHRCGAWHLSV